MGITVPITKNNISALVYDGQLISLQKNGREFMHAGALPQTKHDAIRIAHGAWTESDIVCFPFFGGLSANKTPLGWRFTQKHGLWRHLKNSLSSHSPSHVAFEQNYGGEVVEGQRAPISYRLFKVVEAHDDCIESKVIVTNTGDEPFPYDLGMHPAFVRDSPNYTTINGIPFDILCEKEGEFVPLHDASVRLENEASGTGLIVENSPNTSTVFSQYGLWSPTHRSGMLCVEPITGVSRDGLHRILEPEQTEEYAILIKPD